MKVSLAYGEGSIEVDFPNACTTVIKPSLRQGLADEKAALLTALRSPIKSAPLLDRLRPGGRICILFTDSTRATPNERIIPWLLEHLAEVPARQITLLNQTGTHRANSTAELERLLTREVVRRYRVENHDCANPEQLLQLGCTREGAPALLNRLAVEADLRIVTGFIEPHFFAGFSGGPKGLMPGVAGLPTIMSNHGPHHIGHPNATFGITEGNPLWEEIRDIALRAGPSFILNVTLDEHRGITGIFAGDMIAAHRAGCEYVRSSAMQAFAAPFDLVVSTNSGYPLDLNLYQTVKGMTAAARVLKPGGTMIIASECREGVPAGSSYEALLHSEPCPGRLLAKISTPGFRHPEQWQAQLQAAALRQGKVLLHSSLPDDAVRAAHLVPCHDVQKALEEFLSAHPNGVRIAVLPEGPLTIPYLREAGN